MDKDWKRAMEEECEGYEFAIYLLRFSTFSEALMWYGRYYTNTGDYGKSLGEPKNRDWLAGYHRGICDWVETFFGAKEKSKKDE